jgi:hypothetical protein
MRTKEIVQRIVACIWRACVRNSDWGF